MFLRSDLWHYCWHKKIWYCSQLAKCAVFTCSCWLNGSLYVAAILFLRMSNRVCTFVRLYVHLKHFVALKLQSSSQWEDCTLRLSLMGDGLQVDIMYTHWIVSVWYSEHCMWLCFRIVTLKQGLEVTVFYPNFVKWNQSSLMHFGLTFWSTAQKYTAPQLSDVCYWAHSLFSCIWLFEVSWNYE
jgi:hypothetical protein